MVVTEQELSFLAAALLTKRGNDNPDVVQLNEYKESILAGVAVEADPKNEPDFKTVKSLIGNANILVCNDEEVLGITKSIYPLVNLAKSIIQDQIEIDDVEFIELLHDGGALAQYRDLVNDLMGWTGTANEVTANPWTTFTEDADGEGLDEDILTPLQSTPPAPTINATTSWGNTTSL